MYRVYSELVNDRGEVIHKRPVCRCTKLSVALTYARVWSNGWPMGIYEIKADGTEVKVN